MVTAGLITLIFCFNVAHAASIDQRGSRGKEFILAFMENHRDEGNLEIRVATEEDTIINVFAPYNNMNETFHIKPGLQKILLDRILRNFGTGLERKGIYVKADKSITIYAVDSCCSGSIDGYLALPTSSLSNEYIVAADYVIKPETDYDRSEFVIAAPENNTRVTIIFRTNGTVYINGAYYSSGDKYTLDMSSLGTLQIQHTHDFTGTMIQSTRPIAVFSGNRCSYGTDVNNGCDHEIEQMVPVDALGHDYIVVPLYPKRLYRFRIISPHNATDVYVQGYNYTLGSSDFMERIASLPEYIHSSKPIMVIQYGKGLSTCEDPSMITIPSVSDYSMNYTFSKLNISGHPNHDESVSVIIESGSADDLILDDTRLNPTKRYTVTALNTKNYTVLIISIREGTHKLYHPNKTIRYGAVFFGTGACFSYGFPLGISMATNHIKPEDFIKAGCDSIGWNVTVDMELLEKAYPRSSSSSVLLGESSCPGNLIGNYLYFLYGLTTCNTQEIDIGNSVRYTSTLLYPYHDLNHPNIVRGFNWTVSLVCDLHKSGSLMTGISHNNQQNSQINLDNQYRINISFFDDPNFLHEVPGNPLHVKIGADVYVKVFTETPDWNIKMRLHTCYVKPFQNSSEIFYLMQNGCEMDINTHIISQSTHETRFVFRDFEFSTNYNGLYLFCEANFCMTTDYTPHCQQVCTPRQIQRIRRSFKTTAAQICREIVIIH